MAVQQVIETLVDLQELTNRHKVTRWAEEFRKWRTQLQEHPDDPVIYEEIYARCFAGTMGSLTDLMITPENGHRIRDEDFAAVDSRLGRLSSRLYGLVRPKLSLERRHHGYVRSEQASIYILNGVTGALTDLDRFLRECEVDWREETRGYMGQMRSDSLTIDEKEAVAIEMRKRFFESDDKSLSRLRISKTNARNIEDEALANIELAKLLERLRKELY